MKSLNFLVIGKDQVILDTLKRIIEKNEGWKAVLINNESLSRDAIRSYHSDIVLLSSGLQDAFEQEIKVFCGELDQNIKVIEHYGGGSGLLLSEVEECFSETQNPGNRILHKADSREKTALDWLSGGKTFSFGDFYDPERVHFGALRVLNDDVIKSGKGFGTHPHDNMEIISIALEGTLIHEDNLGNRTEIKPGDIQVMSAGTGVMHSEFGKDEGGFGKFLQIWVYPKKRNVAPRYDQITLDLTKSHNSFQQILSPDPEDDGVWIYQDAWFHLGRFDHDIQTQYQIRKKGNGVYAFIIEGSAEIDGQKLDKRDGFGIYGIDDISIKSTSENTEILLMEVPMAW
ncbi:MULTISPECIES: pirin family protein [Chryseobacterium]|uniref:Redox-sensitive bicupin YhaK (Pirin superfamily) n=1 Tax=Chryseobacterium camelliae TaxID=1265445 RepID=A0ABU0TID8_9FLAO|nr:MULTISPECIES: pirin family protein [Chryseobacterium]MDT3409324.1 redox-sensitive bicupin YhaK (pirin superfamily) [Pseudacidovorax intermedius]MDQ1096812.1 redox-sensitive bicupin YhaK (pirin superfamily) [Chryseobacterium camelliae]MDQ1100754.1 redox-sensitive bicupin YhaK (pirin superfamily) [Chryseobacterium sp. SORGH_AS_1048]MDR6088093.1 redox-sensitive bicupin YhaK (pirin superfamily) [Chryseobacterium sp. SORGH_AS_0909]MDR6132468.1 redox-sensitive bicupin YhaK (pirin superfamily) [Ch